MQPGNSKYQFLRDLLESSRRRMLSNVVTTNKTSVTCSSHIASTPPSSSSLEKINENFGEIIIGTGYVFVILVFVIKMLLQTIRNFECYYMSPSYNRFGFIASDESESGSESESEKNDDIDDSDSDPDPDSDSDSDSLPSSPISLRPTLCSCGKYLRLQTPPSLEKMKTVTPKTPLPLRRSLRLKIKSELNLAAMQNNSNNNNTIISSDPCPKTRNNSIITPSPHPEHDEEREYYIRYCNEKKMRKNRPEFNSPLFVRRLIL